ncbi:MAG: twin-arginine translocation signal domain-containing protein [Planctomycetota bacterium]
MALSIARRQFLKASTAGSLSLASAGLRRPLPHVLHSF